MSDSTPSLPLLTARPWTVAGTLPNVGSAPPPPEATAGLELFAAAPEAPGADGYAAWKASVAAEKAAAAAAQRRSELPMNDVTDGFARWKEEAAAARRAFEQRWGVPLGKAVRLQLRGESREREGLLRLAEEPADNASAQHLRLTLGGHTFPASQIDSVVRV